MLALEGDERLSGTSKANGGRGHPAQGLADRKHVGIAAVRSVVRLRTVYDDMLREEVPKDFLDLLRKLD